MWRCFIRPCLIATPKNSSKKIQSRLSLVRVWIFYAFWARAGLPDRERAQFLGLLAFTCFSLLVFGPVPGFQTGKGPNFLGSWPSLTVFGTTTPAKPWFLPNQTPAKAEVDYFGIIRTPKHDIIPYLPLLAIFWNNHRHKTLISSKPDLGDGWRRLLWNNHPHKTLISSKPDPGDGWRRLLWINHPPQL